MADADLEEIRRARLAQLQQQGGGAGGDGQDQQKSEREAEARASILSQILDPAAADRLDRIRLVKASRATDVENRLISLARSGQIRQKVTEEQLKQLLGAVAENEAPEQKITVTRRKPTWDDDDDDLLDL
ncbi:DNA-binding TFAR19-related protein [Trichodelitschia bisporula]|uniref:DNA-binding TFAR19-related protein n=1 Tax=Trichodelitschia bisporula TaxID=703511 RepID=A0A6G1HN37_9PEZI|nr:DNA-binding TFAR19-related protein [Trichodelitschia bisporula]